MSEVKRLFGKKIKEFRKKGNLTQAQLAEMVNDDDKHISCIESGKNFPSADLIDRLAKALGVEPKDLFEFLLSAGESGFKSGYNINAG